MSSDSNILSDSDCSSESSSSLELFSNRAETKEYENMSDACRKALCEYMIQLYKRRSRIFCELHKRRMVNGIAIL